MAEGKRRHGFSTAMSVVFLLGTAFVLYKSSLGHFRSMSTFPLIFAIIVAVVLVGFTLFDRKPGWKLRAGLGLLTIVLAGLAPVAHWRFLAAERRAYEARGIEALSGRPAPAIPYVAALGLGEVSPATAEFAPDERVTLINFWATWCTPCVKEIPLLEEFWREHQDAGFAMVGVTKLYGESEEQLAAIRTFLGDLDVSYPVLVGEAGSPGHAAYGVRSLPTSVLVDRAGRVVDFGAGIEGTERLLGRATELLEGTPTEQKDPALSGAIMVETHTLTDDGTFPNNARLPLLLYRQALELADVDPAAAFERLFRANGWGGFWRNGIFGFHHYHSTAHEVLGVASGTARVQLGGPSGITVRLEPGDVVVIPAGVAHKNLGSSGDFLVVGGYPSGQSWDMNRGEPDERPRADENIARVPLPETDPVAGTNGPLVRHWGGKE